MFLRVPTMAAATLLPARSSSPPVFVFDCQIQKKMTKNLLTRGKFYVCEIWIQYISVWLFPLLPYSSSPKRQKAKKIQWSIAFLDSKLNSELWLDEQNIGGNYLNSKFWNEIFGLKRGWSLCNLRNFVLQNGFLEKIWKVITVNIFYYASWNLKAQNC